MRKLSHPFIAELKRYVASQNATLGPVIVSLSHLINLNGLMINKAEEVRAKQMKLSQVTDMIHAAHVFHRCVRDNSICDSNISKANEDSSSRVLTSKRLHQDNVMSLLVGDYLLAQSSVDMADLRYPRTVGLIAQGLEDYTRGEFLKLQLFENCLYDQLKINSLKTRNGIKRYAELTCGSLLSNACLSAALLAGYHDLEKKIPVNNEVAELEQSNYISDIVYRFGFHAGTAHRLIEFLYCPETNSESDKAFIEILDVKQFEDSIRSHLDKATELLLHKIPDGERRPALLALLDEMRSRSRL